MSEPGARVHADPRRGHITVTTGYSEHAALTFTDMGNALDVWQPDSVTLDTITARRLGTALIAWANVKHMSQIRGRRADA